MLISFLRRGPVRPIWVTSSGHQPVVKINGFTVIFLQICFYESRDSLGQNSLHPKLEVLHPIWGPL